MIIRHKCCAIFIAAALLLSSGTAVAENDKYKDVEIVDSSLSKDGRHFTREAFLHIDVKNNGDKLIENLAFKIRYYGDENYLIQKSIINNALNDSIPPGDTRSYKIPLRGDFVSRERDQYPYSKDDKVCRFDVEVAGIKYGR